LVTTKYDIYHKKFLPENHDFFKKSKTDIDKPEKNNSFKKCNLE